MHVREWKCVCCSHVCECAPNMYRCANGSFARGCRRQRSTLQIGYHNQVHWQVSQIRRAGLMMSFVLLCGLLTAESQRNRVKQKANGAEAVYESQVKQTQVGPQICVLFP